MIRPNRSGKENKQGIMGCIRSTRHTILFTFIPISLKVVISSASKSCPNVQCFSSTKLSAAYSLQNINPARLVKFRHRIPEHRDTKRKLERINFRFKPLFRRNKSWTLTSACQSDNFARPSFIRFKRRGTFFKPLR